MPLKKVPTFNSPNMDTIKKIQEDLASKITTLQSIGLPGIKDIPVAIWNIVIGQFLLSPRQIAKKKLMIQGSKVQKGDNTSFNKPISEEDAQLIIYGKIYYKNGKLYDKDYDISAWSCWYKNDNYDDSHLSCIAQPTDEDFFPPIDDSSPLWQYAIELVKGIERDLGQLGIRLAEFIMSIPAIIATIVISLVALVSSLIILPIGAGIPPALTAVKSMITAIKEFQAKIAVFLPYMDILERLAMAISKFGQTIISQLQAVFAILAGILGTVTGVLDLLNSVTEALAAAEKILNDQQMEAEPVANDANLESGESTKLDAGPSGGGWNYNYQWTDDSGNVISTDRKATVSPEKTSNYTVKLTDKTTGETKTSDIKVKVRPAPETKTGDGGGTTITTTKAPSGGGTGPSGGDSTTSTSTTTIIPLTTTTTTAGSLTTTTTTTESQYCYGALYNWYVVDNIKGIAPVGWHVPTFADFNILTTQLGGYSVAGGHLKETGTLRWLSQSPGCDNSSGFSGKGSGYRILTESGAPAGFSNLLYGAYFWSSTPDSVGYAWVADLNYAVDNGGSSGTYQTKYGLSIRLVKDNSTNTGHMIDYDGNTYGTVKIGNQVWMSSNLYVTHYNNGDVIPEVTSFIAWTGLTTGALCAYNNNWNICSSTSTTTTTSITSTTTSTSTTTTTTTTWAYYYNIEAYDCDNCLFAPESLEVHSSISYTPGTGTYYPWIKPIVLLPKAIKIISIGGGGGDGDISTLTGPYASCVIACAS